MKYKLIKCYPNSPKLGTTIDTSIYPYYYKDVKERLKQYPEFWQPETDFMSTLTNSPKGSLHWLNTIGSRIAHIGEYMQDHPEKITTLMCTKYGKTVEEGIREIMEYFKDKLK
jgi:hypothetical protein